MLIRSILFDVFFIVWTILVAVFLLPLGLFKKTAPFVAFFWGKGMLIAARIVCGIRYKIIGIDNLPVDEAFIIASKHQSAWDTIVLLTTLKKPAYILKKELLKIPFYGWYLNNMGMIAIDRSGSISSLKAMIKKTKQAVSSGQSVIIFPQGTRTPPIKDQSQYPYKPGISIFYTSLKTKIIPAALNSGLFWPKGFGRKKKGTIIMEFFPAMRQDLASDDFKKVLEETIENGTNKLISLNGTITKV